MSVMYFVWLGSGRAKRRHVDLEGRLLDQAAKAGLPVAPGAILLDEFYRVCLKERLVEIYDGRHIIPDAELLHATLFYSARLPRFEHPIATSLVTGGGGVAGASVTPRHRSVIDAGQPGQLAGALAVAWDGVSARGDGARRDVLLLEEIAAEHSGRARLRDGEGEDHIEGYGEDANGTNFALPVLTGWRKPDEALPPYAQRLQMLLRGVRHTFGRGDWAVEWADDGQICRLRCIMPLETG